LTKLDSFHKNYLKHGHLSWIAQNVSNAPRCAKVASEFPHRISKILLLKQDIDLFIEY